MKYIINSSQFNQNCNVSINFSTNRVYDISRTFLTWASQFSMRREKRTERQKDMIKAIVTFHKCFGRPLKIEFDRVEITV